MPNPGRPTEPHETRRAAVRDSLFEAVTTLLADGGTYVDLSVNAMVSEAGIAKSTFYQYFTGKNDLLNSFVEQVLDTVGETYEWLDFDGPPTPEAVRSSVGRHVLEFRPYLALMAAAFEAAYFDAEVRQTVDRLMASLHNGVTRHIRTGQARGWIDPGLPPVETGMWLTWMVTRGVHRLILSADETRIERLVAGIGQTICSALYRPGVTDRNAATAH